MSSTVKFSHSDHNTWQTLYDLQTTLRSEQIIPEFSLGLEKLKITRDKIPDLSEVNRRLETLTKWQGVFVKGFIEPVDFFKMLADRKFPIGSFIRDSTDLSYTPEPDIFHDLYGHMPFFTIPAYADFCQKFAEIAYDHKESTEKITQFQRFFWFTFEFGLLKNETGLKILGAGIASSFKECAYALSSEPNLINFNVDAIMCKDFRIDVIQKDLFVLNSLDELFQSIKLF